MGIDNHAGVVCGRAGPADWGVGEGKGGVGLGVLSRGVRIRAEFEEWYGGDGRGDDDGSRMERDNRYPDVAWHTSLEIKIDIPEA